MSDIDHGTGICFRCGSTEHKVNQCKVRVPHGQFSIVFVASALSDELVTSTFDLVIAFLTTASAEHVC